MKLSITAFTLGAFASLASAQEDIATIASTDGRFGTLVAALGAAGLVSAVSEPSDPLTVFAPVDDAFAALPDGLVDCLLLEENVETLVELLTYHVVEGSVLSTDLSDGMTAATLAGPEITISITDDVVINGASTVIIPDIEASNGVIHVVDNVIVPPDFDVEAFLASCNGEETDPPAEDNGEEDDTEESTNDIATIAVEAGSFETLVAALDAAGLVTAVSEPNGPFTVFAPTDDAFAALPDGLVDCLLLEENLPVLTDILQYHVVEGTVLSSDLSDGMTATALNDDELTINIGDSVTINDSAAVVDPDIEASNGVIHVIDAVLVPPDVDIQAFLETCPEPTEDEDEDEDPAASVSMLGVLGIAAMAAVAAF